MGPREHGAGLVNDTWRWVLLFWPVEVRSLSISAPYLLTRKQTKKRAVDDIPKHDDHRGGFLPSPSRRPTRFPGLTVP